MEKAWKGNKRVLSSHPTVVTETNDHQNPCQDPWMNFRGNSSLFQYVSLIPEKIAHKGNGWIIPKMLGRYRRVSVNTDVKSFASKDQPSRD